MVETDHQDQRLLDFLDGISIFDLGSFNNTEVFVQLQLLGLIVSKASADENTDKPSKES